MGNFPKKAFASIGGILVGLISVICSFMFFSAWTGSTISLYSYGGDAYTGIQNAAAYSGSNVYYLSEICAKGFGILLLVLGLAMIAYFLHTLLADLESRSTATKASSDNMETNSEPVPEESTVTEESNLLETYEYAAIPMEEVSQEAEKEEPIDEIAPVSMSDTEG